MSEKVLPEVIKPKGRLKKLYSKEVGKPPYYKNPQDMMTMIDQYMDRGCRIKRVPIGKKPNLTFIEVKILTLSGIALHLGFTSIKQMYNFSSRKVTYAEPIAYAKTLITRYYEEKMQEGVSPTAMIFMMHNLTGMSMNNQNPGADESRAIPQITFKRETKVKNLDERKNGTEHK